MELLAYDASGQPVPLSGLPAWPTLEWHGLPYNPDAPVYLLDGALDDALVADLQAAPLLRSTERRARVVQLKPSANGFVQLEPQQPLERGALFTLAVLGHGLAGTTSQLRQPLAYEVRVDAGVEAGAKLVATLPAHLQRDVPMGLRRVHAAFDGLVDGCGGLALHEQDGTPLSGLKGQTVACDPFGPAAVACCELSWTTALNSNRDYTLALESLTDAHGGAVLGESAVFTTGDTWDGEAALLPLPCTADETSLADGLCAQVDDRSVALRIQLNQPAFVSLTVGGTVQRALAKRGELQVTTKDLAPAQDIPVALRIQAAAGPVLEVQHRVRTLPPLLPLSITEVRSDPLGPEPAQEYVELWNYGPEAIALAGLSLSDDPAAVGMELPPGATIPENGRLLLVPDGFVADSSNDTPIAAGVTLIRCGRSLARSGLANRGEPVLLRDASGHRLSEAPPVATGAGLCLLRHAGPPSRRGGVGDFSVGTCSPGE